jgi:hypothetical protein
MKWWPLFGIRKQWTEKKKQYPSDSKVDSLHRSWFQRSLFIYVIDVGSSNGLNFEITALESPQYNIHRLGIFFTDSPRHADILLVLGRPTPAMIDPLQETISQLPEPFGIITVDDHPAELPLPDYPLLPGQIAHLEGVPKASEILGVLLKAAKKKTE